MKKPKITFGELLEIENKLEIRIGQIIHAERVPKSNGLKLTVIFGENKEDERTAFTNLGKHFEPEALLCVKCPFIMNLEPSEIKGVKSEVMIMVAEGKDGKIEFENFSIGAKLM